MLNITTELPYRSPVSRFLPVLGSTDHDLPIADWRSMAITRATFLAHVQRAAASLPDRPYVINLCANRYIFLVAFAAAIVGGRTNLLPPSRVERQVRALAGDYPDHQIVTDTDIEAAIRASDEPWIGSTPQVAEDHLAALVFTSGSTGSAQAHPKLWGTLVEGARLANARFRFDRGEPATVVATVPAQHMYGLETSILLPLMFGIGVHDGQPFYAEDIRSALAAAAGRRILITTPMHLRVCVESGLVWPSPEFILSATAPLSATLAARAEQLFDCRVLEIYGCTEAGSLASRRTIESAVWRTYDGLSVNQHNGGFEVQGSHLGEPIALNDRLKLHDANRFELAGRAADLFNIAGKRASLGDLTHKLNAIDGVQDGIFLKPPDDETDARTARLIALVVAPGLDEKEILRRLAECIDPAFMPRRLYRVERLPRNDLGKLPREELLTLVQGLQQAKQND